jgi:O-antigen/teichoic acid export membrane protein
LLAILMPAFVSISLGYLLTTVLIATRRTHVLAVVAAVAAGANIVANILLIPIWGARAAAATTVATELAVSASVAIVLVSRLKVALPWRRVAGVGAATAVAAMAAFALRPVGLVAAVAGSAVIYLALVLVTRGIDVEQVRPLLEKGATVVN